jgi:hypothetical protein
MQSEVKRFGRRNSDDSGEEEMYERAESELTATKLPRKAASEATRLPPRPARKVNSLIMLTVYNMYVTL